MTKLMLEAIEALRQLPAEQQDDAARAVLRLAGRGSAVYKLAPEEKADSNEADQETAHGDFVSVEEVRHSIEESRTHGRTNAADKVFDRLAARLDALAPQE